MIDTTLIQLFHKDYATTKNEITQLKIEILDLEITLKHHYKNLLLKERKLEELEYRATKGTK